VSVIRVQAFRFSIVNYLATAVAAVSTLWIYPLELDAYGLAQLLVSISMLCIPMATLGTLTLVVKFFPEYKAKGFGKSYLFNVLVLGFGFLSISGILALCINEPILKFLEYLSFDAHVIAKHKYVIAALVAIMLYNNIAIMHASNYNRIAVPTAYQNLLPKLFLPILIICLYTELIDMALFARLWVLSFVVASMGLTWYLSRIDALDVKPVFHFFKKDRLRRILSYVGFTGAGSLGSLLIGKIDVIMVGTLLGLKEAGVYGMALFIGNVLTIPANAVWQIASPVLSEAFEKNDWVRIRDVYQRSSTNLLVIGILIYFGILGSLDSVLLLSPNYDDISTALPLFAIIGLSKLVDMGASVNQYVLMYSSKYRSLLVFVLIMAVCNVLLNYFFIKSMGILGAALATFTTVYIYQILKYLYIDKVFNMYPFSAQTWRILLLFVLSLCYYLLLPKIFPPIFQAMVYGVGLVVLYVFSTRILKVDADVVHSVENFYRKAQDKLREKRSSR
jgi:O-antigen/teichoic acid export membrane protein